MADWEITATTIYCDAIDDEATLLVDRDGTAKCTGYDKYHQPDREAARALRARSKRSGKQLRCEGLDCHRIVQYRDRLAEETGAGRGKARDG